VSVWRGGSRAAVCGGLVLAIATALGVGTPGEAQRVPEPFGPTPRLALARDAAPVRHGRAPALQDTEAAVPAARLFAAQTIGGTLGSVVGIFLGASAGSAYYDRFAEPCYCEDPGLGHALLGAAIGSAVGTALFSHASARLAGGHGGQWPMRLGAAAFGVFAGLGAVLMLHADPDDGPLSLVVFPLTQAAVTALATPGT
jgi:hypothetical protein